MTVDRHLSEGIGRERTADIADIADGPRTEVFSSGVSGLSVVKSLAVPLLLSTGMPNHQVLRTGGSRCGLGLVGAQGRLPPAADLGRYA